MLPKIEIPSIDTGDFKFGKQTAEKIIVPTNKDELWNITRKYTGIEIPRVKVCENHDAPFDAFARAYFADVPIIVCIAARGLGGKSVLLAALGMIEAITLKTSVNLLGGSGEQSERIHNYMKGEEPNLSDRFWGWHEAPKYLLRSDPTKRDTKLTNEGIIRVLMASQRSVRGPHPTRLRMDEVDEMNYDIFKAALGQTMISKGVKDQILLSSTHHKPLGTMTEILKMANSRGWPIYRWCYKETQQAWLNQEMIDRKKATVFDAQWKVEYDLEAPTAEGTAIMAQSVEKMFNKSLGSYKGNLGEYIEIEPPAAVCRDCNKQAVQTSFVSGTAPGGLACPRCRSTNVKPATYVNSADWAKERHFTDIMTIRTDINPKKLVAYERTARLPWPNLIKRFDKRCNRYPGANVHDGIGIGNVIDDIMKTEAMPLELRGKVRRIVLSEYIVAVEDDEFVAPYIESVYNEHMYCTIDDLFGSGHLPDSVCAGALGNFGINRAGWARGMA